MGNGRPWHANVSVRASTGSTSAGFAWLLTVLPENLEVSEWMWLILPVIILVDASSF